jgi:hypothetical protein
METFAKKLAAITCGCLLLTGAALASPPQPNVFDRGNEWSITGYLDQTGNHQQVGTQRICFLPYTTVGTSIQGVWYSTTFPDWNGLYYQEGDEVKMTGDFARDTGHDHMTLLHTTYDVPGQIKAMAFKDWTEWLEDGRYGNLVGWANAKMERIGKCRIPVEIDFGGQISLEELRKIEQEVVAYSRSLPERLTVQGEVAVSPGQPDLESVESYLKRIGQ